jgi:hypothetical protein
MAWKPDYVSADDLAAYKRITDDVDDTQLGLAVSTASRAVDNHTHRQFGKVAASEERTYAAEWSWTRRRWVIVIDDLMDDTITVTNADGAEITDYTLEPRNAEQKGKPWEQLVIAPASAGNPTGDERLITIDGPWGWTAIPDAVKQATLLQGSRLDFRRVSPAGVAGSPDQGSELRLLARLDPDVAVSLKHLIRWWAAA